MTDSAVSDAQRIIAAFGGIRPTAKKLGVAVTTVQGWKERGAIPVARLAQVRAAAEREGIDLSDEALAQVDLSAADPATEAGAAPKAERVRAEKVGKPVDPGIREAKADKPPDEAPPVIDAVPADRRQRVVRPLLFGAAFGLAFAAGVAGAWLFGLIQPAAVGPGDPALARRLTAAEIRLAGLRKRIAETAKLAAALSEIKVAVSALNSRIDRLPPGSAQAGKLAATVTGLSARLAALQQRIEKMGSGAAAKANAEAITKLGDENAALRAALKAGGEKASAEAKALSAKIAELEARVRKVAPVEGDVASANAAAIGKLRAANEELTGALKEALDRVAALEAARSRDATGRLEKGALIVAIGQLREAALSGGAYAEALAPVKTIVASDPELKAPLATLERFAAKGVPTVSRLRAGFERLAVDIVRAGRRPESGDWLDRAWARARSIVIVRRTGKDVPGQTPEAIVARSEAKMSQGDLAGAVKTLEGLEGTARKAAEGWLSDAQDRLAVGAALRSLNRKAIALVSRKEADKPPGKP